MTAPLVQAVHRSAVHEFSKDTTPSIRLLAGLGVEGDAHCGVTVQHRSRVAQDPTQPNLRQVHLIADETLAALRAEGFEVQSGDLGENITTAGIDLLALPVGTRLALGREAVVELTGLRNPCGQIDRFRRGMRAQLLGVGEDGEVIRKAGVMSIVLASGVVSGGDPVGLQLPAGAHRRLDRV